MKIFDITVTLEDGIPIWPGNPPFELVRVNKLEESASSNVSKLSLGVHTGTHVDAPIHFLQGGTGVDQLPLELLTGRATVHALDLPQGNITATALEAASPKINAHAERVLLKTRNSELWRSPHPFQSDFAGITADGAQWIVDHKIKLIGVDYLSVGPKGGGKPTHEILLKAGVVIVEGLNLRGVDAGDYEFYCLPLKLKDCDGAPARAILCRKDIQMSENELILVIAKQVLTEASPDELPSFSTFEEHFRNSPENISAWGTHDLDNGQADIGFGFGDIVTFLAPWIILVAKETLPLARSIIVEAIKSRVTKGIPKDNSNKLPLEADEVPPASIRRLEKAILRTLKSKQISEKHRKRIVKATIRALLFDEQVAVQMNKLLA